MKNLHMYHRVAEPAAVLTTSVCAALLFSPFVTRLGAQDPRATAERLAITKDMLDGRMRSRTAGGLVTMMAGMNRAVIGVSTSSGGNDKADTAGVKIESVTAGSPADKAGIKAGSRITSVNGVNLKVSALDAEDPELQGIGQRRLLRELGRANPGDEVELRVSAGAASQTYKLKTVSPAELTPRGALGSTGGLERFSLENRASLGAAVGSTGSLRDTLGIFISSVTTGGPAEKAGVFEGDRIAAINGLDVRVPREDAEDAQASAARVNRFMRELQKLAPGDKATLRVYSGGRYREVPVTTGMMSDVMVNRFRFNTGDGVRMMSLPGMKVENMPTIIRRLDGDTSRIVRKSIVRKPPHHDPHRHQAAAAESAN
ncbi:MAG: PDZ domain-containing protein [Gemmatimonadaceae bacterium]